jgi:Transposase
MDPFHVVRLAGDALDQCRRRVQQATCGHRGRKGDPLYAARRALHTGAALITEKQQARLEALFAVSEHVEVEATWGIYQRMIAAYREPDKKHGKAMMQAVIDSVASGFPATLTEIRKLGRTLKQRATDILALFDRPGTSNGPAEAINGRLEHLRGSALGFRNLTNYIARSSLLEAGGFQTPTTPSIAMSRISLMGIGGLLTASVIRTSRRPLSSAICGMSLMVTRAWRSCHRWPLAWRLSARRLVSHGPCPRSPGPKPKCVSQRGPVGQGGWHEDAGPAGRLG